MAQATRRPRPARAARSTPPVEQQPVEQPRIGLVGWLRWAWRQLTSMRTALVLLLLVAVAAIPGSVWPQRGIDATAVATYLQENPTLGPWLDRLGFFDVFSSPWFSAIYLLLVVSLCGCILPRTALHWRALRSPPPRAPRHLDRLPVHRELELGGDVDTVAEAARGALRARRRFRVRVATDDDGGSRRAAVSAESGYLRETGNLAFHMGVVVVIVALAWGYLVGWKADRIVVVGSSFTNTVSSYDTWSPGPWVDPAALQPFSVRLDSLSVAFEENARGAQFGAPRDFHAETTITPDPAAAPVPAPLRVNGPLAFGDASVYLLGNGYAPTITVRDAQGRVLYSQPTPFLPQDGVYTSVGAVKVPAAAPEQLGFSGEFLPTAVNGPEGPESVFPDARNPTLVLSGYTGSLFGGGPQSVYSLDTERLTRITDDSGQPLRIVLQPGRTVTLPDGLGSISMDRVDRWAGVSTRYDPARPLALASALAALLGLVASLTIRRRRVFVRVTSAPPGPGNAPRSRVQVGALARGEDHQLAEAVDGVLARLRVAAGGPVDRGSPAEPGPAKT